MKKLSKAQTKAMRRWCEVTAKPQWPIPRNQVKPQRLWGTRVATDGFLPQTARALKKMGLVELDTERYVAHRKGRVDRQVTYVEVTAKLTKKGRFWVVFDLMDRGYDEAAKIFAKTYLDKAMRLLGWATSVIEKGEDDIAANHAAEASKLLTERAALVEAIRKQGGQIYDRRHGDYMDWLVNLA